MGTSIPDLEQFYAAESPASGTAIMITYYGFKEPLSYAASQLAKQNRWNVVDYSLFRWKHDQYDRTDAYLDKLVHLVKSIEPDIILFWYFGLTADEFRSLRGAIDALGAPHVPFALFNWNDPFCWTHKDDVDMEQIAPFFDTVVTCCTDVIPRYAAKTHAFGSKQSDTSAEKVTFQAPGFDKATSDAVCKEKQGPNRFECDVMFACTNLYDSDEVYPNQRVNRRALLDAMHRDPEIALHVYGPERLKSIYPNSYRGYLQYEEIYRVVRTAKVCLTTHVRSLAVSQYINERSSVVLGCGGLLLTDVALPSDWKSDVEQENDDEDVVFFHESADSVEATIEIVKHLLRQPYEVSERTRQNAKTIAAKHLTWQVWAEHISDAMHSAIEAADSATDEEEEPDVVQRRIARMSDMRNVRRERLVRILRGEGAHQDKEQSVVSAEAEKASSDVPASALARIHRMCDAMKPANFNDDERPIPSATLMQSPGAVEYARVQQIERVFENITGSHGNPGEFAAYMQHLIALADQNPCLNVTLLLDNYFRHKDRFH